MMETIEKKIILKKEVWDELVSEYGDKWQEHVVELIEKDLCGDNLTYWARKRQAALEKLLKGELKIDQTNRR